MKTIILAGGQGMRLRPLTCDRPKPMMRILDKPLLEWTVLALAEQGFDEVTIAVRYKGDSIAEYFGDGSSMGIKVNIFDEDSNLGTAGCVAAIMDKSDDDCLVLCGDTLTDINYRRVAEYMNTKSADLVIAVTRAQDPTRFGCCTLDENNKILGFSEKPSWGLVESNIVNTGIYMLSNKAVKMIPRDQFVDFGMSYFPKVVEKGLSVYGYQFENYWMDIGEPAAYIKGCADAAAGKVYLSGKHMSARPGQGVNIIQPVFIGPDVTLGRGIELGPNVCICGNVEIQDGCKIRNSVIDRDAAIFEGTTVDGAAICQNVNIGKNCTINKGTVIGSNCNIGDGCTLREGISIWPYHNVENGTVVSETIFSAKAVCDIDWKSGDILGDYSPMTLSDMAVRIGRSLGAVDVDLTKEKPMVAVGTDGSVLAEMFGEAVSIGLRSTGVNAVKFSDSIMPAFRYSMSVFPANMGVYCYASSEDRVRFALLGQDGKRMSLWKVRKVDRAYRQNEFYEIIVDQAGKGNYFKGADFKYMDQLMHSMSISVGCSIIVFCKNPNIARKCAMIIKACGINSLPIQLGEGEGTQAVIERMRYHHGSVGLVFNETCEDVTIVTESGRIISPDRVRLLYTKAFSDKLTGPLPVCENSSHIYVGLTSLVYTSCELCDREAASGEMFGYDWMSDSLLLALRLLTFIKQEGISAEILDDDVEKTVIKEIEHTTQSKANAINNMRLWGELVPGIKGRFLRRSEGWIHICADDYRNVIRITAEAMNAETAEDMITECIEHLEGKK